MRHALIHPSTFSSNLLFAPNAGERSLDLLLEAGDQFAVGVDQRLLGFDLSDDGLLRGEGWEGDRVISKEPVVEALHRHPQA